MMQISIIIPYKNQSTLTISAVESLMRYMNLEWTIEVLLVNNRSEIDEKQRVRAVFKAYDSTITFLDYDKPFNFQKMNNWAARRARYDTLLFLNNDTELVASSANLLKRMYAKSQDDTAGAVGCVLLYADAARVQHGGVYLRNGSMAEHLYARQHLKDVVSGKKTHPLLQDTKRTAVTAACLMVQKAKFNKVSGFDERFVIGGGDVDLCIRLNSAGFQTWCMGSVDGSEYILHKESVTRAGIRLPWVDYVRSYESYVSGLNDKYRDPFISSQEFKEFV